jgi:hypothetical protein
MHRNAKAGCDAAPVIPTEGNSMRKIFALAGRILVGAIILSALQIVSSIALGTGDFMNEAGLVFLSNLLVVLILAYSAARAYATGLKLVGAVLLVYWGVYSFNTNVEAVFFDLSIPPRTHLAIMAQGLILGAAFAPTLVILLGKWRKDGAGEHAQFAAGEETRQGQGDHAPRVAARGVFGLLWRLAVCALSYVILYIIAGAIAFPHLETFYADAASIPPLGRIVGVQLFRGLVYVGVTYPLVRMMKGGRLEKAVTAGLQLSILDSRWEYRTSSTVRLSVSCSRDNSVR